MNLIKELIINNNYIQFKLNYVKNYNKYDNNTGCEINFFFFLVATWLLNFSKW